MKWTEVNETHDGRKAFVHMKEYQNGGVTGTIWCDSPGVVPILLVGGTAHTFDDRYVVEIT